MHFAPCDFNASVNSVASDISGSDVLISSHVPGVGVSHLGQLSLLPFDGQQPLVQHPIAVGCSETPVPTCSPCTASKTVPCSSSTSRSASTPPTSALVTRV